MPRIIDWFDEEVSLPWETRNESPWSERRGRSFRSFPLSWLVPYANPCIEDLEDATDPNFPLWITDIHPDSNLGVAVTDQPGTFIISISECNSLGDYLDIVPASAKKKFSSNLRKNEVVTVVHDAKGAIDALWGTYVDRIQTLAKNAGGDIYTEDELAWRHRFFSGKKIHTQSHYLDSQLLGVNVSLWEDTVVYDLACMINPIDIALRRSIGTLAILKNIEYAIHAGKKSYDLLAHDYGYKRQFGAKEFPLKAYIKGEHSFFDEYEIPKYLRV